MKNILDILSRFIYRQQTKRVQQLAFLDKLHRTFNDAFPKIYAYVARQISRNVYYRHALISSPCVSRKTKDDLIATRAYATLEAEANLRDRKIAVDLVKVFIAASMTPRTCRPDGKCEISPQIATLSRLVISSRKNQRYYRLINKDNDGCLSHGRDKQIASKKCKFSKGV